MCFHSLKNVTLLLFRGHNIKSPNNYKSKKMKKETLLKVVIFLLISIFLKSNITAQDYEKLDKAPHDISYYRKNMVVKPLVKVIYGRPQRNGQEVFGNVVEYSKVWRTGANEATEVKFYQDITFGNAKVKAGTYVLLTIPGEKEWDVILSSNLDVWGAFQYNPEFNVIKIKVPIIKAEPHEMFSIGFKEKKESVHMVLAWDETRVNIPITFKSKEEYAKF